MNEYCCKEMQSQLDPNSTAQGFFFADVEGTLVIHGMPDERSTGTPYSLIKHCPWCGTVIDRELVKKFYVEKNVKLYS
jgi:hypothetical protein